MGRRALRTLVIGSGGREHAIVWALTREDGGPAPFCAPGNPGIAEIATCLSCSPDDLGALARCARGHSIDLTIVGPEGPLASGIVDVFAGHGLRAFGPSQAAARLEASKVFMKDLCRRYGIPTADFRVFDDPQEAVTYVRAAGRPLVVKADGLAAGKGVVVASTPEEATAAVETMMVHRRFGDAGARVVIEEMLPGQEVSVFALCDGTSLVPLLPVQDHKRLRDGDRGPNTGGMGAYAPVPAVTPGLLAQITDQVLEPVVWAMAREGAAYRGVLFAGIMLTPDGPRVLEFNVRLGDPETQVLMPLLASRVADAAEAVLAGRIDRWTPRWRPQACVCVVLCADGYPERPKTGSPITGVRDAAKLPGVLVFHAGTAVRQGRLVTAGGRVLDVVGVGDTLGEARERAYRAAEIVQFDGKVYRRDIAGYGAPPRSTQPGAAPGCGIGCAVGDEAPIGRYSR
jgi:phosphoribosylamine--glycine ligase